MAKTSEKLSPKQRIELFKALEDVLKPGKKEGLWKYADGFNDQKIAEITGHNRMRVVGVRNSLFGKLENQVEYVPIPEIITRLSAVEQELAQLKANLGG